MIRVRVRFRWLTLADAEFQGVFLDRASRSLTVQFLWLGIRFELTRPTPPAPKDEVLDPCPLCDEPVLSSDESRWLPGIFLEDGRPVPKVVRAHVECVVCQTQGSVGCQRGQCPDCKPPAGQSARDTAREAYAFWKASQGRRKEKGTPLS